MKLTAPAGVLNSAISLAALVTPNKTDAPVHVIAADGKISFACCGLGMAITTFADANVDESGEAVTSAYRLSELLASFTPGHAITLASTANAVTIKCGRGHYQLQQDLDPPEMLAIGAESARIEIAAADLLYLLDVVAAAGVEQTRFNLHGACLQSMNGRLTATSTDGDKLLSASVTAPEFATDRNLIVPSRSVATACKLVRTTKQSALTLYRSRYLFAITAPAFEFRTQLIGAAFPDWTRVVPAAGENLLSCAKSDLYAALTRLAAVAGGESSLTLIALTWDADPSLRVFLPRQPGICEDFITAKTEGRARIALSLPKLQAMIGNFSCDQIQLEVSQDDAPLIMRGQGDKLGVLTSCRWPRDFGAQP